MEFFAQFSITKLYTLVVSERQVSPVWTEVCNGFVLPIQIAHLIFDRLVYFDQESKEVFESPFSKSYILRPLKHERADYKLQDWADSLQTANAPHCIEDAQPD